MLFRLCLVLTLFFAVAANSIEIDMSRRVKKKVVTEEPTNEKTVKRLPKLSDFVKTVNREAKTQRQEIVILNTSKGFVPAHVPLKKGEHYMIHVVNVNKDNKNASFMLDAFSEHRSTYFGETTSFKLDPEKEGVFDFQCPETSAEGKVVVFGSGPAAPVERAVTSEE